MSCRKITPQGVYELMKKSEVIIVDARTEQEYLTGHIEGAVNIPLDDIVELAACELPDLNSEIVVYCKTGKRSALACSSLQHLGYKLVYDMGPLTQWEYGLVTVD